MKNCRWGELLGISHFYVSSSYILNFTYDRYFGLYISNENLLSLDHGKIIFLYQYIIIHIYTRSEMQAEFTTRSTYEQVQLALTRCFTQSSPTLYKVTLTFLITPQMRIWRSLSPNS